MSDGEMSVKSKPRADKDDKILKLLKGKGIIQSEWNTKGGGGPTSAYMKPADEQITTMKGLLAAGNIGSQKISVTSIANALGTSRKQVELALPSKSPATTAKPAESQIDLNQRFVQLVKKHQPEIYNEIASKLKEEIAAEKLKQAEREAEQAISDGLG